METQKISHDERQSLEACREMFEQLALGLKSGVIHVSRGDEALSLHPGQEIKLRFRGKSKGDKEKLQLELEWQKGDGEALEVEYPPHSETPCLTGAPCQPEEATPSDARADAAEAATRARRDADRSALEVQASVVWVAKEHLYEMAKDQDVKGRSSMSKEQLASALVERGVYPLRQLPLQGLYELAREADVSGRSNMDRGELVAALERSARSE